jgi:F-type H+-transporting ATPase subunit b
VSVELADFLFEVANFLLLAALLGWVLFKPVRAALDRERERHDKEEAQIRERHAEADKLAQEAHEIRARLEEKMEDHKAELVAAAREEAGRITEQARQDQLAEQRRFEQELASARRIQANALAATIGQIAAASVRRLLDTIDAASLDVALIRAACAEIEKLPADKRADPIVEAARPLDASSRELLGDVLGQTIKERIVKELGAGVRITMSGGQVDASAEAIARHTASEVAGAATGKSPTEMDGAV